MFRPLSLLVLLALAAPAAAQLPCAVPGADPCLINSTVTIPVGLYDIRPKSLSVGNKQITVSGAGELKILANNITFQPGARFIATGTDGNTAVTLDAAGTIDLQSQGTSKSKIDVSGNFGGGSIDLHSVGNLSVNGTLIANATNTLGFGGPISLTSDTGNVVVTGDPSEGIRSFGNSQGSGGSISIAAMLGSITVSTQLVPKGGDCGGCEVELTAGTDITTTAAGVIDLRASGVGDGGTLLVTAGGNLNLGGNMLANGSSDDLDGGAGGDLLIDAGGSITIGGRVELNGAGRDASLTGTSVDGDSGSSDVSAGTFIQVNGPIFGLSKGFGQGDEVSFDAPGNITLAGEIDMSGDNFGGDITALAYGLITVSARLRTATPVDPVNKPSALGGNVDIEGCQINVTAPNGQVIATGPGGNNLLVASTGFTITGPVTATYQNEFDYRTSAPVYAPGLVTPPPMLFYVPDLPCCGVSCPTTTTTTSTTSTTSTSSTVAPTTSTSSTVAALTTTSSTAPGATSTTSTVAPSTSTTVASTTSTSSTAPVTSSTSTPSTSSSLPTTTSAPVVTTTTATVTTPPTTSTTSPPLTCLDTAIGIDAVRCRLDLMSDLVGRASEADLGGRKLAKVLAIRVGKAKKLSSDPPSKGRLKKAAKQLKQFATKLGKAVSAGKANATLGAELGTLATEAQSELAGLTT